MRRRRAWTVRFGSHRLRVRDERRRARNDIRNGREPAPVYRTGKHWEDEHVHEDERAVAYLRRARWRDLDATLAEHAAEVTR